MQEKRRTDRPPTRELLTVVDARIDGLYSIVEDMNSRLKSMESSILLLIDSYKAIHSQVSSLEKRWLDYINHRSEKRENVA